MKLRVQRPKSDKQGSFRDKGKLVRRVVGGVFVFAPLLVAGISCVKATPVKETSTKTASVKRTAKADGANADSTKKLSDEQKKKVVHELSKDRLFKGGF